MKSKHTWPPVAYDEQFKYFKEFLKDCAQKAETKTMTSALNSQFPSILLEDKECHPCSSLKSSTETERES